MSDSDACKLTVQLKEVLPCLVSDLAAQAGLNFLPERQGASELSFASLGQPQPALTTVFPTALRDPAMAAHDGERASQGCAVHGQHLSKLSLSDLSRERKRLQDSELGDPQPERPQRLLVKLGQRPRGFGPGFISNRR